MNHKKSLTRLAPAMLTLLLFFCQKTMASGVPIAPDFNWTQPWAVNAGPDAQICAGGSTQLQASGANTYNWAPATGLSCTNCPNPVASPSVTTTYLVTGDDGTMDELIIKVLAPPVISNIEVNQPTDCNLPNGSIVVTTLGIDPYEYSIDGGNIWQNNGVFTALGSGNYSVRVRGNNGTCDISGGSFVLAAPPAPQILNILESDPSFCDVPNGSIVISASGGISPLQYSIDAGQTWQAQNTFQLLGSGNYQIRVRNANGTCEINGSTVSLTASPDEAIIADIFSANPTNCNEQDGLITIIVPNSGGQFEFSINGGISYQPSNSFTGLDEGIYHILIRRTDGTCLNSGGYIELVSPNRPTIYGVSAVNPQGCGSQTGNITILAFGPSTLQFSIDGGTTWHNSNIFSNLPVSTYNIKVRNDDGSCVTDGGTFTLTEPGPPVITSVNQASPTACGLTNGSIKITATGMGLLEYSINGGGSWQSASVFNNLPEGSYTVRVRYVGGGCTVSYGSNPVVLDAPGAPPSINAINTTQPSICGVANGSISILASASGPMSYSINGGASFQQGNTFNNLGAGTYPIVVSISGGNCSTTGTVTLFYSNCTDTVQVNIPAGSNATYCIEPAIFNNLGNITSAGFCDQGNAQTVVATSISQNCVTLSPAAGFVGISPDLICTIHCFNNSTTICDTTFLRINVQGVVDCDPIFAADTVSIPYIGNPTNYCVPVPLTDLPGFDLSLNGVQFTNPFVCDFEPAMAYTYTLLPGAGFGGPYSMDAWAVGANSYTGFFNDVNELLALMVTFDPAGNWQIDTSTGLIYGGNPNTTYGDMEVTHLPSSSETTLQVSTTPLPTGFTVGLSDPGISVLIVQNPADGCADTLYIDAQLDPTHTDTVFLTTTVNMPTSSNCLSGSELPGGVVVNVGYCEVPANGVAPLSSPNCVFYVPGFNFAGQDQFCMVACDGDFPQTCDTTYFIINVLPQNDTVYLTIPTGTSSIDTCLTSFVVELPGAITSASFCAINTAEINGTINGNCLTFSATGSFYGTTTACVSFCSGGFCDENTVIVTIVPPIICEDIFDQSTLNVATPLVDNKLCIPIPTGEIVGYEITVDGSIYAQSFVPCGFDDLVVYSYASLPAGPYTVNAWTANGTPFSGVVPNIGGLVAQMNIWDPNGDWVENPASQTILGGLGGTYSDISITPAGGAPQTLAVNSVILPLGSQIVISGYGSHEVIVTAANGCADTLVVNYTEHVFSTDTLVFNTTPNTAVSLICGNTSELLGNFVSANFCGLPGNGAFVPTSDTCFTYTPNTDFVGSDTVCMVFCDDNPVPICDTFVFVINVGQPCPEIFSSDEVFVSLQNGVGEACIPIAPAEIINYEILLDGQPYTASIAPCDVDEIYFYSYGQVFGQGASGPYSVSWTINGQNFSSVVQNMQELVAQMNIWDVTGNWNIEQPTFSITSTNDNGVYGNLIITHIATGILSIIAPTLNSIPAGTALQINGTGQHEIVVQNLANGCADTLTVNALNGVNQLDIFTYEGVPSDVECLDITGLPSTFDAIQVCQAPADGLLNISGNCFTFIPDAGFVGTNTACLMACDDLGNCGTTLVNITVGPLCSLYDFFPDTTQELVVIDCADIAAYCTSILLDSVGAYGVLDNGFPYTGGFVVCNGQFAQISLDTGQHEIIFLHLNTGCQDTLLAYVTCTPNNGCGTTALSPLSLVADDCTDGAQFCVSVPATDLPNFLLTDNGGPFTGTAGLCDLNGTSIGLTIDTGLHVLILADTVKGCADTFQVEVRCNVIEDVVVDTIVEQGSAIVLCLEDFGFPTAAIDSVVVDCVSNGNTSFSINNQTWCITFVGELIGLDTACFEVFVGDTSAIFTANITVITPCPTLIPGGLWAANADCTQDIGMLCLPFGFLALADKAITLDGAPYDGQIVGCGQISLFTLNYDALPSEGLIGPYILENWNINGTDFTGVFNTIQELADSMNLWDVTGTWQIVVDPFSGANLIQGGDPANVYSVMTVEQQLSGIQVELALNMITVPTAVAIELEVGTTHQLTITDTVTLCSETALVELVCLTSEVVTDTLIVGVQDTFCLDLTELVGNIVSVTNACPGSNGETVLFSIDGNCIIYNGNEPGLDSACMVVCDDVGLCDTTYFFITVNFSGDSLPIAVNDTVSTGQGLVLTIPVLNNDTVQFLLGINIITQPSHGDVTPNNASGTITYVPDPGYCDEDTPDSFTYAICNPAGCDTATVYVTVLCSELQIFQAFSPNGDSKNETFKITGLQDYPNHHLYIYNRWGVLVYEAINYLSDWEGTYKDKKLPDGTYFYVLDLGDGDGVKKGYVVILR